MLADWSSIAAGFGIVWTVLVIYGFSLFWRLRRVEAGGKRPHGSG